MHAFRQPTEAPRGQAVARILALLVLLAAALMGEPSHADPNDFQAMPGLWKIVMRKIEHGHAGAAQVQWHCVDEGPDPWVEFANLPPPGEVQCERSGQRRTSTALAWTLTCPGHTAVAGRVDFDSPEHYTASLKQQGKAVVQVEGQRFAACTSPKD